MINDRTDVNGRALLDSLAAFRIQISELLSVHSAATAGLVSALFPVTKGFPHPDWGSKVRRCSILQTVKSIETIAIVMLGWTNNVELHWTEYRSNPADSRPVSPIQVDCKMQRPWHQEWRTYRQILSSSWFFCDQWPSHYGQIQRSKGYMHGGGEIQDKLVQIRGRACFRYKMLQWDHSMWIHRDPSTRWMCYHTDHLPVDDSTKEVWRKVPNIWCATFKANIRLNNRVSVLKKPVRQTVRLHPL